MLGQRQRGGSAVLVVLLGMGAWPAALGAQETEREMEPETAQERGRALAAAADTGAALAEVLAIKAAYGDLAGRRVWPGFDPGEYPVAIAGGGRTWLLDHPSPPPGFEEAGAPGVWVAEGQHEAVRANSTAKIGGVTTATLLLSTLEAFPSPRDRAGVAVHEAFHAYEARAHPDWGPGGMGLETPVADARVLALRRMETALLRRALEATNPDSVAALAAAAVEARRERYALLPASVVRFERGMELMEGTAQHVQAASTGSRAGLMTLPADGFEPEALFMRNYAMGLALTTVLERLDPQWEAAVEAGAAPSLDRALAALPAVAGARPVPWRHDLRAARARADRDVAGVRARRDSARAAFLARDGWRITVEATEAAPLGLRNLDPANLIRLGGAELLHTRWVRLGNARGQVEVLDRSALTRGIGGDPLGNGFAALVVTGFAEEPAVTLEDGAVVVRAAGFEARFEGAEVERGEGKVVVRL